MMDIHQADDLLAPGYLPFESGYADLRDVKKVVAALTRRTNSARCNTRSE
jgi:hypothetical protein